MGRFLTLTNSNVTQLGYRKRTLGHTLRVGPVALKFIFVGILFTLMLFYISQSNQASLKGYEIQDLQDTMTRLQSDNQKLNLQITRLKSLQSLEETDQLNLVQPSSTEYMQASAPVASAKSN